MKTIDAAKHSLELVSIVERMKSPRIMVVGDLMIDEYIYGFADRLSPEAPVPVLQERNREERAGGAANVAAGLAALGAQVFCVGVCGADGGAATLERLLKDAGVQKSLLLECSDRPTTRKTRLVGLAQHRHAQQMLRLDREVTRNLQVLAEDRIADLVVSNLDGCQVLAIEDYNKGLFSLELCQRLIESAKSKGVSVLVDPANISDYGRYRGATMVKPNRFEGLRGSGLNCGNGEPDLEAIAATLIERMQLDVSVLTLDKNGIHLKQKGKEGVLVPTRPRSIYDVTGAGDMVLAMLAMAHSSGASWEQACMLANVVGGLEVEKFGIVPITKQEVLDDLARNLPTHSIKCRSLKDVVEIVRSRQCKGQKIVFTNGVFDLLHAGHVFSLEFAKQQGDLLVVGVNSDDSTRRIKGDGRPRIPLADRMAALAGLQAVDLLVGFDELEPTELIKAVRPDILVKGSDYIDKHVAGREFVEANGGEVVFAPLLPGRSTTAILGTK